MASEFLKRAAETFDQIMAKADSFSDPSMKQWYLQRMERKRPGLMGGYAREHANEVMENVPVSLDAGGNVVGINSNWFQKNENKLHADSARFSDPAMREWYENRQRKRRAALYDVGAATDMVRRQRARARKVVDQNTGIRGWLRNIGTGDKGRETKRILPKFLSALNPVGGQFRPLMDKIDYVNDAAFDRLQGGFTGGELSDIGNAAFLQELNNRGDAAINRHDRHAAAFNHLEGRMLDGLIGWAANPIISRVTGKQDLAQLATGRTTSELANDYEDLHDMRFGPGSGKNWARALRTAGIGSYVAGAAAPVLLTGGSSAAAGGAANGSRFTAQALHALKALPSARAKGSALFALGDAITDGGRSDNMVANIANVGAQIGGSLISDAPLYALTGATVSAAGKGLATKVLPRGVQAFGTRASQAMAKHAPTRFLFDQAKSGLNMGLSYDLKDTISGDPHLSNTARFYANTFTGMAATALGSRLLKSDALQSMINSGRGEKEQEQEIDRLLSSPQESAQLLQDAGLEGLPQDQQRDALKSIIAAKRAETTGAQAMAGIDPDFDWANASPAAANARMAQLDPDAVSNALFKAYKTDLSAGGRVDPMVFANTNMTSDQRRQLLSIYLRSEDDAHGGTFVGQLFRGADDVAVNAMKKSPDARNACIAFARGEVSKALQSGEGVPEMSSTSKAVMNELSADERRQVLSPLMYAAPDQILALQQTMGNGKGGALAETGEQMIMDRLRTDGDFVAQFLPAFSQALQQGQGLEGVDASKYMNIVRETDVPALLSSMSDDNFFGLSRWLASNKGSADMMGLDEDTRNMLETEYTAAAKSRALQSLLHNPIKNLPNVVSLWTRSKGWDGAADVAQNPIAFYASLALLVGGSVWLGSKLLGGDEDDSRTDAGAVMMADRQRSLLAQDLFGNA